MNGEDTWPIAIDPPGCGCTECLIGQYVPLDRAIPQQIIDLFAGRLHNNLNSGTEFDVTVSVRAEVEGLTWKLDPAQLGLPSGLFTTGRID